MSDELGLNCLLHYNEQHVQVRKDFFGLCTYDKSKFNNKLNGKGKIIRDEPDQECMAKILRVIETLTNTARKAWYATTINAKEKGLKIPPQEPKEYPIELAYGAMHRLMYETHSESIIRNSVAVLVQKGFILRRQETSNSIPVYILNRKLVQEELKKQEECRIENRLLNIHPNLKRPGRPRKQKLGVEFNSQASENNTQTLENNRQVLEFNTNNIGDKKGDNKQTRSSSANISETEKGNNNDLSFSVISSSKQDPSKEPTSKGNSSKTPNACFKDEVEQAIWDTERAANIVKRNRPAPADREHVADIAESLRKHNFPVEQYTVEFVKDAWNWKMDCNPNLKDDCKLANHVTAVPEYILAGLPNTQEIEPQDEAGGVSTNFVIWTPDPDQAFAEGPVKSKRCIALFERMSEEEAVNYGYGYWPGLSFDELDRIKSYLAKGK